MSGKYLAAVIALAGALAGKALAAPGELVLDPEGFTVQLIALPTAERLQAFVRERGVSELLAAEVRRDGSLHYVLLLGTYADRASASAAAANLPAALSDLTPWVRPMASFLAAIEGS